MGYPRGVYLAGAVATALFVGGTALGQGSTTTCRNSFGTVVCDTRAQPSYQPPPPMRQFDVAPLIQAHRAGQERRLREQEAARHAGAESYAQSAREQNDAVRRLVGRYIQAGSCTEAVNLALEHGEIALAEQARSFCGTGVAVAPAEPVKPTPPPVSILPEQRPSAWCETCQR